MYNEEIIKIRKAIDHINRKKHEQNIENEESETDILIKDKHEEIKQLCYRLDIKNK